MAKASQKFYTNEPKIVYYKFYHDYLKESILRFYILDIKIGVGLYVVYLIKFINGAVEI